MSRASRDTKHAALIAALAAILLGVIAPAAAAGVAENRVGAISHLVEVPVEPRQGETAGQRLGEADLRAGIVVATGVAAKSADEFVDLVSR